MSIILIVVPISIFSFFLGFYLQLVIKILVDVLNLLSKLTNRQDTIAQQAELNLRATGTTFVEPQSLAEIEAQEQMDRIERMNRGEVPDLPPEP